MSCGNDDLQRAAEFLVWEGGGNVDAACRILGGRMVDSLLFRGAEGR